MSMFSAIETRCQNVRAQYLTSKLQSSAAKSNVDLFELDSELKANETEVALNSCLSITDRIGDFNKTLANVEGIIDATNLKADTLATNILTSNETIGSLMSTSSEQSSSISLVRGQISSTQSSYNSRISSLNSQKSSIKGQISSIQSGYDNQLNAFDTRRSGVEGQISSIQSGYDNQLNAFDTSITALKGQNGAEIADEEGNVVVLDLSEQIEELEAQKEAFILENEEKVNEQIEALELELDEIDAEKAEFIAANEGPVKEQIAALELEIDEIDAQKAEITAETNSQLNALGVQLNNATEAKAQTDESLNLALIENIALVVESEKTRDSLKADEISKSKIELQIEKAEAEADKAQIDYEIKSAAEEPVKAKVNSAEKTYKACEAQASQIKEQLDALEVQKNQNSGLNFAA
ncbi:MAG: hypothetical protein PHV68_07400 [Candidatus Gastranaerophilales bacterium]|nr:hypothetical protein [Candidatus Gastranaerophilales bacterium]